MGLGIVLIFWGLFWAAAASGFGLVVATYYWRKHRERPLRQKLFKSALAVGAPLAGVAFMAVWFTLYMLVCAWRGYDPGLGDSWSLPLSESKQLLFIDTMDRGYLTPRGGGESRDILRMADGEGFKALALEGGFLVLGPNGREDEFPDELSARLRLEELGAAEPLAWQTPQDYYNAHRGSWIDLAWFVTMMLVLLSGLGVYFWLLMKEPPLYALIESGGFLIEDMALKLVKR